MGLSVNSNGLDISLAIIDLGAIHLNAFDIEKLTRLKANLDGTTSGDFTPFDTKDKQDIQVTLDNFLVIGQLRSISDSKNSITLGYADDAAGLNFVEVYGPGTLIQRVDELFIQDILFTFPTDKFPMIRTEKNITIGSVSMDGIALTVEDEQVDIGFPV